MIALKNIINKIELNWITIEECIKKVNENFEQVPDFKKYEEILIETEEKLKKLDKNLSKK